MIIKTTFKESMLIETINTRFDKISWNQNGNELIGIGLFENQKVQLIIIPHSYRYRKIKTIYTFLNLIFKTWDGNSYSEEIGHISTNKLSSLISCITLALSDKVKEFEWDWLTLIAKNNINSRMKLYSRIGDIIVKGIPIKKIQNIKGNEGIIILSKKDIDIEDIWDSMK